MTCDASNCSWNRTSSSEENDAMGERVPEVSTTLCRDSFSSRKATAGFRHQKLRAKVCLNSGGLAAASALAAPFLPLPSQDPKVEGPPPPLPAPPTDCLKKIRIVDSSSEKKVVSC